ncbi:hypothetical protein ACXZ1K_05590 [Pedobacter sp. PWIIR3]
MNKRILSTVVLLCSIAVARSQNLPADSSKLALNPVFFKLDHLSLQLQGGTQGLGMNFRYDFFPFLAARAGGSFGSASISKGFNFDNIATDNHLKGVFSNVHALAEISPVKWLRLVGGVGYLFDARGRAVMTPTQSVTQEGITLEPEELGTLTANIKYKEFAPYMGIGFGKGLPKNRFNVNLDLGVYHLSRPDVTMTGTEYLSDNSHNGPIIAENMKDYRWMPIVQLNFNFRIAKK